MKNCVVIQNINDTETNWAQIVMQMLLNVLKFAAALFWETNILPRSKVWAFRTEINKYTSFCVMYKRCLWWRKNPMRSDTEVLLHWTTARLRSCDSWHGMGCHEYLQTLVLALGTFFQWIFIKDTHLKEFWKMWNDQKFSINQKHLLWGKQFFYNTSSGLWYWASRVKCFCYHLLLFILLNTLCIL